VGKRLENARKIENLMGLKLRNSHCFFERGEPRTLTKLIRIVHSGLVSDSRGLSDCGWVSRLAS
jgi:hypothetical protein